MKKIEILTGSPRKKGNTIFLAKELIQNLNYTDISASIIRLYDYDIKPCIDCRKCKKDKMECIVKDGMQDVYPKIEEADFIIVATPIYWYGPSAKTKLLLDRLRPHYENKKLSGKKGAVILPAGTGVDDCDLTIEMFKRVFDALGMEMIGAVTSKSYDIGEAEKDAIAVAEIKKLAKKIRFAN